MSTKNDKPSWGTHQEEGMRIRILNNIENGLIKLKEGQSGRIYHCYNQVDADIYFNNIGIYWDDELSLSKLFNLDKFPFQSKPQLQGLVLNIKRKDYALEFEYRTGFYDRAIREEKLDDMTFFAHNQNKRHKAGYNDYYFYYLEDVTDIIEESFAKWVEDNATFDEATEEQLENGEWEHEWNRVLDDHGQKLVGEMKDKVELEFAKITGIWYDFNGGLYWE